MQGVGTVVSGTTLRGLIKLNDTLLLGPDPLGNFLPIAVKSIHRKRMPVKEVRGGQTASFALKKVSVDFIGQGYSIAFLLGENEGFLGNCQCSYENVYFETAQKVKLVALGHKKKSQNLHEGNP